MILNQRVRATADSPIGATFELLEHCPADVLDLAQAAPTYPPAPEVVERVVAVARGPHGAEYCDIAGLPTLREAFAAELATAYIGDVRPEQVAVTAGCNQAFCLALTAIADPGDEVVLTLPFYFNHDMWLRMSGLVPRYLEPGPDLTPSAAGLERVITERTRAVVVVTPGNPTGLTLGRARLRELLEVARRHGVALVLDETYRSFRDTEEPPHDLFADPEWADTLVSLHSFSKDLALPGYRVGALVASAAMQWQVAKVLDCVAICAPRVGQEAALAGLESAGPWRAARAAELAERRGALAAALEPRPGGFELLGLGGFFAWVRHPFGTRETEEVCRGLAVEHGVLVVPGTAFLPDDRATVRVSVSNLAPADVPELAGRLAAAGVGSDLAGAGRQ